MSNPYICADFAAPITHRGNRLDVATEVSLRAVRRPPLRTDASRRSVPGVGTCDDPRRDITLGDRAADRPFAAARRRRRARCNATLLGDPALIENRSCGRSNDVVVSRLICPLIGRSRIATDASRTGSADARATPPANPRRTIASLACTAAPSRPSAPLRFACRSRHATSLVVAFFVSASAVSGSAAPHTPPARTGRRVDAVGRARDHGDAILRVDGRHLDDPGASGQVARELCPHQIRAERQVAKRETAVAIGDRKGARASTQAPRRPRRSTADRDRPEHDAAKLRSGRLDTDWAIGRCRREATGVASAKRVQRGSRDARREHQPAGGD